MSRIGLTVKLLAAEQKKQDAINEIASVMKEIIAESDIQVGDTVKIVANKVKHRPIGAANGPALGNEAIGLTVHVLRVDVHPDGEVTYTTDWRDKHGLLWCWTREELDPIGKRV